MKPERASDRVRLRLKEALKAQDISQRELADGLSRTTDEFWTQSRVAKVLNGNVELKVDDVDAIAKVAGIFISEAVRDRGLEFYAEMTPTELRILERIRQKPNTLQGLMLLLDMQSHSEPRPVSNKPKRGRPLNSAIEKRRA